MIRGITIMQDILDTNSSGILVGFYDGLKIKVPKKVLD